MEEIWKDIDGYEGFYQVSNLGSVKSLNYRSAGYPNNLKPKKNCKGYLWVILYRNAEHKCVLIHRLVAMAFVDNPDNLPVINHKDENPLNNRADNLEWCTNSYNVRYSMNRHPERRLNGISKRRGCRFKGVNSEKRILQLSMDGSLIREWSCSRDVFLQTGMSDWSISECCRGNRHKAYGYIWRYADEYIAGREVS